MSTTLLPSPPPNRLPDHKFTAAEFNHMGDLGWFEGRRAFLLDGVIKEVGPMDPPHANALEKTTEAIRAAFGSGWRFRNQSPLHIDEYNDPMPALAVLAGQPENHSTHPTTAALVVEIADSTLNTDITVKAERYATAGIADYWVLDIDGKRLLVFRDPQPLPAGLGATAYRTHLTLSPADRVSPLAAPAGSVLVGDLLP